MSQSNNSQAKISSEIELRPAAAQDREFLVRVYAASREIELAMVPWNAEQIHAFIEHQFSAQTAYYEKEFPTADHKIIVVDLQPVGRLYVNRTAEKITILDITVLPEHRQHGVGTALINQLLNESRETGRPVDVCVETFNPSQDIFKGLGFVVTESNDVYLRLTWQPHDPASPK